MIRSRPLAALAALAVFGAVVVSGSTAAAQAPPGGHSQAAEIESTTTFDQSLTTTPPLDADHAPDYDNSPDLDVNRITGPSFDDGRVTSTTFWPLGFGAVAVLGVFVVIVVRAARGNRNAKNDHP